MCCVGLDKVKVRAQLRRGGSHGVVGAGDEAAAADGRRTSNMIIIACPWAARAEDAVRRLGWALGGLLLSMARADRPALVPSYGAGANGARLPAPREGGFKARKCGAEPT